MEAVEFQKHTQLRNIVEHLSIDQIYTWLKQKNEQGEYPLAIAVRKNDIPTVKICLKGMNSRWCQYLLTKLYDEKGNNLLDEVRSKKMRTTIQSYLPERKENTPETFKNFLIYAIEHNDYALVRDLFGELWNHERLALMTKETNVLEYALSNSTFEMFGTILKTVKKGAHKDQLRSYVKKLFRNIEKRDSSADPNERTLLKMMHFFLEEKYLTF